MSQVNLTQQAPDHNFELSFKLSSDGPRSSPTVPVSSKIVEEIKGLSQ